MLQGQTLPSLVGLARTSFVVSFVLVGTEYLDEIVLRQDSNDADCNASMLKVVTGVNDPPAPLHMDRNSEAALIGPLWAERAES